MKVKICAMIILAVIISSVTINTVILDRQIGDLYEKTTNLDENNITEEEVEALISDFEDKESFMSLTVSHYDLTDIGYCLVEMRSYLKFGDYTNAIVAKNRLEYFLKHLRRLSGFNLDSII